MIRDESAGDGLNVEQTVKIKEKRSFLSGLVDYITIHFPHFLSAILGIRILVCGTSFRPAYVTTMFLTNKCSRQTRKEALCFVMCWQIHLSTPFSWPAWDGVTKGINVVTLAKKAVSLLSNKRQLPIFITINPMTWIYWTIKRLEMLTSNAVLICFKRLLY